MRLLSVLVSKGRRALIGPRLSDTVSVEPMAELRKCVFIGSVSVGYRSYANETLLRNVGVGRFCSIGRRCSIGAAKHDLKTLTTHPFGAPSSFESDLQTQIGHDVWIGDNVVIMAGLTVGTGAVVGAGAIVTKDVPPYAVVLGCPAKVSRMRFSDDLVSEMLVIRWWEYGDYAAELSRRFEPAEVLKMLRTCNRERISPSFQPLARR